MSRKVTVYSTTGKRAEQLENVTSAEWLELQGVLKEVGIPFSGMKAVVGETRVTLESEKAVLPEGDFTLFLMPVKTKSGADRKALMAAYKANPDAQAHFKSKGLQITRMKTDAIEAEMAKVGGSEVKEEKKPVEGAKEKSDVVESVKKAAAKKASEKIKKSLPDQIEEKKAEIEQLTKDGKYSEIAPVAEELKALEAEYEASQKEAEEAPASASNSELIAEKKAELDAALKAGDYGKVAVISGEIAELEKAQAEAEEAAKKAEAEAKKKAEEAEKKAKKELQDKLDREAHDLAKEFKDVRY